MEIKFKANKITCEQNNDDGYIMIGFSDNGDEPNQYVILQKALSFDEQDIKLGMDSYYFEYSDESNSGYGVCKKTILTDDKAVFSFKTNALNVIEKIEIQFDKSAIADYENFTNMFYELLNIETNE